MKPTLSNQHPPHDKLTSQSSISNRRSSWTCWLLGALLWCTASLAWAINAWEPTDGPQGTDINALALHAGSDTLFAGTRSGIFRRTLSSPSWTRINQGLTSRFAVSLAVHSNGQLLFAGAVGGVFKSQDGGDSWAALTINVPTRIRPNALQLHPNGTEVYVGTDIGVFRSLDGGDSWVAVNNGLSGTAVTALVLTPQTDQDTLFAVAHGQGIYKSVDKGESWISVNADLSGTTITTLAAQPDGSTLWAGTQAHGVFKSTDRGQTWVAARTGIENQWIVSLAPHPDGRTVLAGARKGPLFQSSNGGDSWSLVDSGKPESEAKSLLLHPNGTTVFAGTKALGVLSRVSGAYAWSDFNSGLIGQYIHALALAHNDGTLFAVTGDAGLFKRNPGTKQWQAINSGRQTLDVTSVAVHPDGQTLFAGTGYDGVYLSHDGGTSWTASNAPLLRATRVSALALHSNGTTLFAATPNGVHRSLDAGVTWAELAGIRGTDVASLALHPNGTTLYAGTLSLGVLKSTDLGNTWVPANQGIDQRYVSALALHSNGQTLYAGTWGHGVYKSTDGGASWHPHGLASMLVSALALHPDGQTLLAGTYLRGVYKTTNGGQDWAPYRSGLAAQTVRALAMSPDGQTVFAGTDEESVYLGTNSPLYSDARLSNVTLVATKDDVAVPLNFGVETVVYWANVLGPSVILTPTAWDTDAAIQVDQQSVVSGASATVPLAVGDNAVKVKVTSGDQSETRTYTFNLRRTTVAPAGPTNVQATAGTPGSGEVTVSWTASANGGSSELASYVVTGTPSGTCTAGPSETSCTVVGLEATRSYQFRVAAVNAENISRLSSWSNSVIPLGVQTISFDDPGTQTVGIPLVLNARASSGLAVAYAVSGDCSLNAGALSFLRVGVCSVVASQTGSAQWAAAPSVARSIPIQAGTPGAPAGVQATSGDAQARIEWTAPTQDGGSPITGYVVRSLQDTARTCTPSPATALSCIVTGLSNGTDYAFTVTASNGTASATSAPSNTVTPKGQQSIDFSPLSDRRIDAELPPLAATASSGLNVEFISVSPEVCTTEVNVLTLVTAGRCTIEARQPGNEAWDAAPSVPQSFSIHPVPPGTPGDVRASPSGSGRATVRWSAPLDTGGELTGYRVTSHPGQLTCTPSPSTERSCTFTELTNGQTYTFTVEALNSAGSSIDGDTPAVLSNRVTPLADPRQFSATMPEGTMLVSATGGGPSCGFEYIEVSPPSSAAVAPPEHLQFPYELLDFTLADCDQSEVTIDLSFPATLSDGVEYWKISGNQWAPYALATVRSGSSSASFKLRDGGPGDEDGEVNGRIVDPGQVAINSKERAAPVAVPTLSFWALGLLAIGMAGLARRRR